MPIIHSKRSVYAGIDPGMSGGLVCIGPQLIVTPMPPTERDIWDWFEALPPVRLAVIEKVHSMPRQGVASTFKFGCSYGGLRMALIASKIPFQEVTPQTWIKGLGIPGKKKTESGTQWKNRLKGKAQQFFPQVGVTLKTADALLIARYCQKIGK